MNNFHFYSPTHFVFGEKTEQEAGSWIKRLGGRRVLIHYGSGSVVRSGLLDRIKASLDAETISYVLLGGAQPNPRAGLIYEGIDLCRKESVDFVLAVGGGSTIDSAKAIALGVPYDGDFWDFYREDIPVEQSLPVGVVLTIAAAGSEGSANTVVTHEKGMLKRAAGGDCLRPRFSILNPELTFTLPAYQTACGATDIMVHLMERYFTNTEEVEMSSRLCEGLLLTMIKEVPRVLENPTHYGARANIMWTGAVAHTNLCGVGREQDWASHNMEHELSGLYDCAHGAGLAVIVPAWMSYVYKHDINQFARFAVNVWGCTLDESNPEATALEGIRKTKAFFSAIGMPTSFAEIGAKEEDIPFLVKMSLTETGGREALGRFVPLYAKDIEAVYRLAL